MPFPSSLSQLWLCSYSTADAGASKTPSTATSTPIGSLRAERRRKRVAKVLGERYPTYRCVHNACPLRGLLLTYPQLDEEEAGGARLGGATMTDNGAGVVTPYAYTSEPQGSQYGTSSDHSGAALIGGGESHSQPLFTLSVVRQGSQLTCILSCAFSLLRERG